MEKGLHGEYFVVEKTDEDVIVDTVDNHRIRIHKSRLGKLFGQLKKGDVLTKDGSGRPEIVNKEKQKEKQNDA